MEKACIIKTINPLLGGAGKGAGRKAEEGRQGFLWDAGVVRE